jgi:hypothetical protein
MSDALINVLHEAGVSCPELAAWTACDVSDGRRDRCEPCPIGGPDRCDSQVIKALAHKLAEATRQTDEALAQRDGALAQRDEAMASEREWRGAVERLTAIVDALDALHTPQKQ